MPLLRQVIVMLQKRQITVFLISNVIMVLIGMQASFCQDIYNNLAISSTLKNFNLNSVTTLENEQIQTNAFAITILSRHNNFSVYASISFYSSSNGYVLPSGMLSIKLNTVVPSRTANFNDIPITGGNQLIIQGARTGTQAVTYRYNMNVGPMGFDVPPGTFNTTILFTMTQQ